MQNYKEGDTVMAKSTNKSLENQREFAPALSPEAREAQISSLAYDLVEQRIRDGTATSQETTYFLKLGSPQQKLEIEKKKKEIALLDAKTEAIKAEKRMEEVYMEAINAMRLYQGIGGEENDEEL